MIRKLLRKANAGKQPAKLDHERLTSLINSMADGVIAVDSTLHVVIYNGAALNVLDLNTSIEGKSLASILKAFDHNNQKIDIEKLVRETVTSTSRRDLLLHYTDSSEVNLYLSVAPVHLGYGQRGTRGYVLLLRDITREKSLEEERDEFISVISHELRTPLAIAEGNISNAQYIAQNSGDVKQIQKALEQSHEQIIFLAGMVNDLATLSRAERGKLNVDIESINVTELVADLRASYLDTAKEKDLEFKTLSQGKLPPLQSSRLYVREILQNFITNAIKYTDKGSVTITAKAHDKGILFTITDTGIGISKADLEKIYDKFFRSEDYRTRKNSGTGLGLYVTLKLARLLHAEIETKSQLDKGSTFSVYIPNLK